MYTALAVHIDTESNQPAPSLISHAALCCMISIILNAKCLQCFCLLHTP